MIMKKIFNHFYEVLDQAAVANAFEHYRTAANELVNALLPKRADKTTHDQIIVCMIIQKTGETIYSYLKEMGYVE